MIVSQALLSIIQHIVGSIRALLPIILIIAFFQVVVLQQPFPDLVDVFIGLAGYHFCIDG